MVTITVGKDDDKASFDIHRGLLAYHSTYFRAELSGRWGDANNIELKEQSARGFKRFFGFIYTGSLWDTPPEPFLGHRHGTVRVPDDLGTLTRLWVLGDYLQAPRFKNLVMDAMIQRFTEKWYRPAAKTLGYACENSPPGSGLRKFFTDVYSITQYAETTLEKLREQDQAEFAWDVVIAMHRAQKSPDFKQRDREAWATCDKCDYHDHNDINASKQTENATEQSLAKMDVTSG